MLVGLATFFLVFLHDLRDGTNALKPRKNCVLPPTSTNSMVLAFASKNKKNRCRSLLNETAHQYHAPSLFWQSSGSFLEGFGSLLGLSSAQLERSWGAFGLSWGPLRCLLASFWVLLGCSWSHLGSHRRLCARFWMVLGASWLGFGELWGSFRYHFRRRCANCCRDPSMAFTLAFRYLLAARRYVRSTSAASRRESRACQIVILSSS